MNEIVMPKLSDTMTEGRIVSWKKRVGEPVRRGDVIAEVETDKANMELEAFASGVLLEIRVQAGELAPVGTVIALIGKAEEIPAQAAQPAAAVLEGEPAVPEGEPAVPAAKPEPAAAAAKAEPPPAEATVIPLAPAKAESVPAEAKAEAIPAEAKAEPAPAAQKPEPAAAEPNAEPAPVVAPGAGEAQAVGAAEAVAAPGSQPAVSLERAAPVVRRRARELGIDLSQVQGSGPDGRILLQDLERHEPAPAGPVQPAAPDKGTGGRGPTPLSRLRGAVAKTVSESWRSIPHFTVTMDIPMDEAESVRRQLKQGGMPVTVNDVVVKAVSLALQQFPRLNASFVSDGIEQHNEINIGIAVGVPEGVLVPIIAGCQRLSLSEISQAGRALVERARSGSLNEHDMGGGTFSVSNLGMYGVSEFTAIIYPSQTAVLAVGAVLDAAVVRSGVPACAKLMKVTLCADHRVADGAYAAEFLVELRMILENPVRLLL